MTTRISTENKLGRIIRNDKGEFEVLLEGQKFRESNLKSDEIVCGAYIFNLSWIKKNLPKVEKSETGEYYITTLINIAKQSGDKLNLYLLKDSKEWCGINTPEDLLYARKLIKETQNHA